MHLPRLHLPDLFTNRRLFYSTFTTLYIFLSSPIWGFTVNFSPLTLEFSRNRNISSHFEQQLETATNALPPKRSFTNTLTDYSNSNLCNVCPTLHQNTILLLCHVEQYKYYLIFSTDNIISKESFRLISQPFTQKLGQRHLNSGSDNYPAS